MRHGTALKTILPVALLGIAGMTKAQDVPEVWQRWYSATLKVSFESLGKPVEEVVELNGPIAEVVGKCEGIGFNVEGVELSLLHFKSKEGVTLSPTDTLERRLRGIKDHAPDFHLDEQVEKPDSDFPYISVLVSFQEPDESHSVRRLMVVGTGSDQWILEARGITNKTEKEATYRFLESLRMDKDGKIKPGDPKKAVVTR